MIPEAGTVRTVVRRRPTRRHRRKRLMRRALFFAATAVVAFAFATVALRHLTPSLFRVSTSAAPTRESAEASRNLLLETQQEVLRQNALENRPVYPYSVVAGGVRSGQELKWMADHDPVVRQHYAGFDYDHARLVRLVLARTAYVSYRIGNKIYWTRRRITLHAGETVLTDGKITARTRCANRVEELPQQANSSSEPPAEKFEEPVEPAIGTAQQTPPVPFQSSLLNPTVAPGTVPSPPLSVYDPFMPGLWIPIAPPPLPGVCGVGKKSASSGTPTPAAGLPAKKKGNPCASGGGEVPEPGTWLLVASGIFAMFWMARRRRVLA